MNNDNTGMRVKKSRGNVWEVHSAWRVVTLY